MCPGFERSGNQTKPPAPGAHITSQSPSEDVEHCRFPPHVPSRFVRLGCSGSDGCWVAYRVKHVQIAQDFVPALSLGNALKKFPGTKATCWACRLLAHLVRATLRLHLVSDSLDESAPRFWFFAPGSIIGHHPHHGRPPAQGLIARRHSAVTQETAPPGSWTTDRGRTQGCCHTSSRPALVFRSFMGGTVFEIAPSRMPMPVTTHAEPLWSDKNNPFESRSIRSPS